MRRIVRSIIAWPSYRWVLLFLGVYFVIALAGTWANFVDLHLNVRQDNIIDLSINQQALSSTIHGNQPYPFYEAQDCGGSGRCSFLLVHPVFFAYLVAGPYALDPSALTLFALQDAALALAALPLFMVARAVTSSDRLGLLVAAAYLVWWPAFTAIFSFHWEAFIPLELFTIFWLWLSHRFWLAVPVVLLSYVTLEVMSVLIFLVALFFLWDWFGLVLNYARAELHYLLVTKGPADAARMRIALARARNGLLKPRAVRASLLLLLGSGLAYLALHEFVTQGGGHFGLPALPTKYAIPVYRPVYEAGFTVKNFTSNLSLKVAYWIVIFGTLAVIPLLAVRTWVLSLPWVLFSMLSAPGYYQMGTHYVFVTAAVVFLGFVYGVAWLQKRVRQLDERRSGPARVARPTRPADTNPTSGGNPPPSLGSTPRGPRSRRGGTAFVVTLVLVITFNLFLNPFNPGSVGTVSALGQSYVSENALSLDGFNDTSYLQMERLASLIPGGAPVAVASRLYTFVANDPYAYPLTPAFQGGVGLQNLPFNPGQSPQYVILTTTGVDLPSFLAATVYDGTVGPYHFGVEAWIPTSYLGAIWLLESNFTGVTQVLGGASLTLGGNFTGHHGLVSRSAGRVVPSSGAIEDAPNGSAGLRKVGPVFLGPGVSLTEGSYLVSVDLNGTWASSAQFNTSSTPVLSLDLSGNRADLQPWYLNASVDLGSFASAAPFSFPISFDVPFPLTGFEVTGTNLYPWLEFQVNSVLVEDPSP